ncbi:hypothetical protein O3G_MSEX008972 [Manduca sexta]|uniref:Reverse transcriptase domain-containing protein n=1 Tax=Manduca sexta TaxID=7130 RepID=A0A921ZCD0_MANSE|nr:hypothetical protein O3G_MSEX008972 [Manduca sexta]
MDFTHSSRNSWTLLRKLGGAVALTPRNTPIHPDAIAKHMRSLSRATNINKKNAKHIRIEQAHQEQLLQPHAAYSSHFDNNELTRAINLIKCGKAVGLDNIFLEFLTHFGKNGRKWLLNFFNKILETAKVIAILKPGKPAENCASYRPISLLSVSYKHLGLLLYNRISPILNPTIPPEQAGFRPNRNCTGQVLALTSHIEAGFQRGRKDFYSFCRPKAAYNTVWVRGLLYNLSTVLPCRRLLTLLKAVLGPRNIKVVIGDKESFHQLKNVLPQGSVLAPILFNIYTSDLRATQSNKFIYANHLALAFQSKHFEEGEPALTQDLQDLDASSTNWRLCPNPTKTEVNAYHLSNSQARKKTGLKHNFLPRYLRVIPDRSLTYREHQEAVAQKVKIRVNLIDRLAGTSWGSQADVFRMSALALIYSSSECCVPAGYRSAHTKKVDFQLHKAMRRISGTLRPTPLPWLSVLANITPQR